VKYIGRDKTNERDFRTYGPNGTAFGLVEANAAGPDGGTTFDGRYIFGPTVDYDAAQAFVVANPNRIPLSVSGSIANSLLNDYEVQENITATYAMLTIRTGRLTVIPGIRVEETDGDYKAKQFSLTTTNFDQGFNLSGHRSYVDAFPSVNARFDVNDA